MLGLCFSFKLDWGSYIVFISKTASKEIGTLILSMKFGPLTYGQNIASLSLFYRYCFTRCLSELAELVPLLYFQGSSTCYSKRLYDFSVAIPRCYKYSYLDSLFPHAARL